MREVKGKHDQPKQIDTAKVCRFLSKVFVAATEHMGKNNTKGTELHKLQVEFSYYLDNIQRGPTFFVPKVIADCNAFIDGIVAARNAKLK